MMLLTNLIRNYNDLHEAYNRLIETGTPPENLQAVAEELNERYQIINALKNIHLRAQNGATLNALAKMNFTSKEDSNVTNLAISKIKKDENKDKTDEST